MPAYGNAAWVLQVKKYPDEDIAMAGGIILGVAYGLFHTVLEGIGVFLCMTGHCTQAPDLFLSVCAGVSD